MTRSTAKMQPGDTPQVSRHEKPIPATIIFDPCRELRVQNVVRGEIEHASCQARIDGRQCERRGQCVEARVASTYGHVDRDTFQPPAPAAEL